MLWVWTGPGSEEACHFPEHVVLKVGISRSPLLAPQLYTQDHAVAVPDRLNYLGLLGIP